MECIMSDNMNFSKNLTPPSSGQNDYYIMSIFLYLQGASRETDVFEINITPLIFSVEFIC